MKLNRCSNCQGKPNEDQDLDQNQGDYLPVVYCPACNKCTGSQPTSKAARIAWNAANPINDTKMEQNEALKAVQQALAAVLFERFALPAMPIYRDDLWDCYVVAVDLLIAQGVLIEDHGRIALK